MLTKTDKKNAIWNSIGFVGVSLLGFVNFSLNYATFPAAEFGVFIFINAIFGIGNSLDFGFGVSTVKLISEYRKKEEYETVNKIFMTHFIGFIFLGVLILIGFWVYFFFFLRNSPLVSQIPYSTFFSIFVFLSLSFLFRYINNYLNRVYEGFAEFILYSKISISTALLNTALMLALFFWKLSLDYLAIIYFISGFVNFLVLTVFLIRTNRIINFSPGNVSLHIIKKYAVYNINIQLSFFVNSFVDPLIKYFIGTYLTMSFVTYFESAKKIIDMSNGLIFSAQKGVLNKISEHNALNRLTEFINTEISTYSKMSNYYSIALYGLLNTALCAFILIWFKSFEGMLMFLIFILPYSLINSAGCLYLVLMVEGNGKRLLILQSINFVVILGMLFLSLSVSGNYFGLFGFYASTIITIILLVYFLEKYHGFYVKQFIAKIVFPDIVKLNILILLEIACLYFFKDFFVYVLISFTLAYGLVFMKYIKFFVKTVIEKSKTILSYI